MRLMAPVGQLYIADGEVDTIFCINNFFSALKPEVSAGAVAAFGLTDDEGQQILEREFGLPFNGSLTLSARELMDGAGLNSPLGMAYLLLAPEDELQYRDLGDVSANFFTYYADVGRRSLAMVHPQSALGVRGRGEAWRSNQSLDTEGLEEIRIYQANHAEEGRTVEYSLGDFETGRTVYQAPLEIAPLSAAVLRIPLRSLPLRPPVLFLSMDSLPTPNGKPLILRRFRDGRFSMSHS